jgi:hypothetical protein
MEKTLTTPPKRSISRTGRVARENKWVIEVLDPELQEQCKSYENGQRIMQP